MVGCMASGEGGLHQSQLAGSRHRSRAVGGVEFGEDVLARDAGHERVAA